MGKYGEMIDLFVIEVEGSAKRRALGCAKPASWLPLAVGRELTQPRAHLLAHLCRCLCWVLPDSEDLAKIGTL